MTQGVGMLAADFLNSNLSTHLKEPGRTAHPPAVLDSKHCGEHRRMSEACECQLSSETLSQEE